MVLTLANQIIILRRKKIMKKILVLMIVFALSTTGLVNAANSASKFTDLRGKEYNWVRDYISDLVDRGIINGRTETIFDPNANVTVEEFFIMVKRSLKNSIIFNTSANPENVKMFADSPMRSRWSYNEYLDFMEFLAAKVFEVEGITVNRKLVKASSFPDGIFKVKEWKSVYEMTWGEKWMSLFVNGSSSPMYKSNEFMMAYQQPITREKAAALLGFFMADSQMTSENILGAKDWLEERRTPGVNYLYRKYINEAVERGIFTGTKDSNGEIRVKPKETLTRVEAAALIYRFRNQVVNLIY